jgi:hypothetical protein
MKFLRLRVVIINVLTFDDVFSFQLQNRLVIEKMRLGYDS